MAERHQKPLPADQLLAAYELGLLDVDDRVRVEAALLADPDLLEELYDAAPTATTLLSDPGRFATAAREAGGHGQARNRRFVAWQRPRVLASAAGLVALATILLCSGRPTDPASSLAVLEPLPAMRVEVLHSAPSGAEAAYAAGLDAYRDGTWERAARSFTEAASLADPGWPRHHEARLLTGSSLLLDGRANQAVIPLRDAAASPLSTIREQALWQLVQARLVLGEEAAARQALASLMVSPAYGHRAAALLEQLESGGKSSDRPLG